MILRIFRRLDRWRPLLFVRLFFLSTLVSEGHTLLLSVCISSIIRNCNYVTIVTPCYNDNFLRSIQCGSIFRCSTTGILIISRTVYSRVPNYTPGSSEETRVKCLSHGIRIRIIQIYYLTVFSSHLCWYCNCIHLLLSDIWFHLLLTSPQRTAKTMVRQNCVTQVTYVVLNKTQHTHFFKANKQKNGNLWFW